MAEQLSHHRDARRVAETQVDTGDGQVRWRCGERFGTVGEVDNVVAGGFQPSPQQATRHRVVVNHRDPASWHVRQQASVRALSH